MLVTTGSAFGTVIEQSEIYVEGAPQIYYGKVAVPYMYNPDTSGFYWQLSGTTLNPVYALGCYENVTLSDNLDVNEIRCDTVGAKGLIAKRNYIEVALTLKSLMPFTNLAPLMNGSAVVAVPSEDTEFFGLGQIDNSTYYKVYMPKVYDELNGDYVSFTLHRCRFVSTGQLSMVYGNTWTLPVTIRAFADTSLPTNQQFATVMRRDPSDGL
jgi:hypothetical protein